jgi:Fe-S-cluster containining protein
MRQADPEALEFFRAIHHGFDAIIAKHRGGETMLPALNALAFTSYEGTVGLQTEDLPAPACRKGCATCCTLRVVATAPEVFLVARYIRAMDDRFKTQKIDIRKRIARADELTRGRNERERVRLRRRCPYIHAGACVIYPVRPLACRSHMSYSRQACLDAAAGRVDEVPYSPRHLQVRSLVQNAMQSALRDARYPWATYELNHALSIALDDDAAEATWLAGGDVLGAAQVVEVGAAEMADAFDQILGRQSA